MQFEIYSYLIQTPLTRSDKRSLGRWRTSPALDDTFQSRSKKMSSAGSAWWALDLLSIISMISLELMKQQMSSGGLKAGLSQWNQSLRCSPRRRFCSLKYGPLIPRACESRMPRVWQLAGALSEVLLETAACCWDKRPRMKEANWLKQEYHSLNSHRNPDFCSSAFQAADVWPLPEGQGQQNGAYGERNICPRYRMFWF